MEENRYSWNKTLKFSWGHIIAFVALIFISYVAYMGDFYMNGGDFMQSAIKVFILDVLLLLTFIGAQIKKGADEKFGRSLVIERILICLCPVVFIFAMIPYNHFWTVFAQREEIKSQFNKSIVGAKQMFEDYQEYSNDRIANYSLTLDQIVAQKAKYSTVYRKSGFTASNEQIRKENFVLALKLQLLSQNTDSLQTVANNWIDEANQGASVWNAFLIGNIAQITDAIDKWHSILTDYSKPVLSNEIATGKTVSPFDENKKSIEAATSGLNSLKDVYTNSNGIETNTIITGIILFLMLLFPYMLQSRNLKAHGYYSLIPRMKSKAKVQNSTERTSGEDQIISFEEKEENVITNPVSHEPKGREDSGDDLFNGTF